MKVPSPIFVFRGNRQARRRVKHGVKYASTALPSYPRRGLWEKDLNKWGFLISSRVHLRRDMRTLNFLHGSGILGCE